MDEVLEDLFNVAEKRSENLFSARKKCYCRRNSFIVSRERAELWGLVRLGKAFSVVAYDSELGCGDAEEAARKSDKLKMFIREYFTEVERSVPDTMPAAETCQHQVGGESVMF